jgi:hypothetical protein
MKYNDKILEVGPRDPYWQTSEGRGLEQAANMERVFSVAGAGSVAPAGLGRGVSLTKDIIPKVPIVNTAFADASKAATPFINKAARPIAIVDNTLQRGYEKGKTVAIKKAEAFIQDENAGVGFYLNPAPTPPAGTGASSPKPNINTNPSGSVPKTPTKIVDDIPTPAPILNINTPKNKDSVSYAEKVFIANNAPNMEFVQGVKSGVKYGNNGRGNLNYKTGFNKGVKSNLFEDGNARVVNPQLMKNKQTFRVKPNNMEIPGNAFENGNGNMRPVDVFKVNNKNARMNENHDPMKINVVNVKVDTRKQKNSASNDAYNLDIKIPNPGFNVNPTIHDPIPNNDYTPSPTPTPKPKPFTLNVPIPTPKTITTNRIITGGGIPFVPFSMGAGGSPSRRKAGRKTKALWENDIEQFNPLKNNDRKGTKKIKSNRKIKSVKGRR